MLNDYLQGIFMLTFITLFMGYNKSARIELKKMTWVGLLVFVLMDLLDLLLGAPPISMKIYAHLMGLLSAYLILIVFSKWINQLNNSWYLLLIIFFTLTILGIKIYFASYLQAVLVLPSWVF